MSKLIPQTFIEKLLNHINIVDVINTRVELRHVGTNFVGLCPFHNEKTPSFVVNQTKQFFHCFGCGVSGNAISFIMQFERLDFIETVNNLASLAGIPMPKLDNNYQTDYLELYKLMENVCAFFEKQLIKNSKCIDYLKSRKFTGEICKKFNVGYVPDSWNNLQSIYSISFKIKQQLITTGLLVAKENKIYARFRGRIMFPIRNFRGQIVGFGGRTLKNDQVKYLNSPESVIFHKSGELYGLYEAKLANNKLSFIIVVEGYLDIIALAQFGITNTVATLGTAISNKQVQLLLRCTSEIIFCFDGDQAGYAAAWRALENTLPLMRDGIWVKFLFLPDKEDPDSLIKKEGKEAFIDRVTKAISLADFFFKKLLTDINLTTIDGRSKLIKLGQEWIKKMPHSVFKQLILNKIAELAKIEIKELEDFTATDSKGLDHNNNTDRSLIHNAISILLNYPEDIIPLVSINCEIQDIKLDGIELLVELISLLKKNRNLSVGAIIEYWRDCEAFETLSNLACKKPIISAKNLKDEFIGIIRLLKQMQDEQVIKKLLAKASTTGLSKDEKLMLRNLISKSKNVT